MLYMLAHMEHLKQNVRSLELPLRAHDHLICNIRDLGMPSRWYIGRTHPCHSGGSGERWVRLPYGKHFLPSSVLASWTSVSFSIFSCSLDAIQTGPKTPAEDAKPNFHNLKVLCRVTSLFVFVFYVMKNIHQGHSNLVIIPLRSGISPGFKSRGDGRAGTN